MTRRKALSTGYFQGSLMMLVAICGFQDYFGLEAYLRYTRDHWLNIPFWPWLIAYAVMLAWQGSTYVATVHEDKKHAQTPPAP